MVRLAVVAVLLAVVAVGALSWRGRARLAEMEAIVAARKELAAAHLAPPGSAPQAGISARGPISVPPFPDTLAQQLREDPDFQRLSHRCGVCHSTPDPALRTAAEWSVIVGKMASTMDNAGLLPLRESDREAVLRVLRRYAKPPR